MAFSTENPEKLLKTFPIGWECQIWNILDKAERFDAGNLTPERKTLWKNLLIYAYYSTMAETEASAKMLALAWSKVGENKLASQAMRLAAVRKGMAGIPSRKLTQRIISLSRAGKCRGRGAV